MEKAVVQIVIKQIFGEPVIKSGISQRTQKPYSIKTFNCFGSVNGNEQNFSLKGFGDDANQIVPGWSGSATVENFNGELSYQIKTDSSSGSSCGSKKVTYTLNELNELFAYALLKVKAMVSSLGDVPIDSICRLVTTYMERATYSGVKMESLNKTPEPETPIANAVAETANNLSAPVQAVQQSMDGTVVNGFVETGYPQEPINNDEVPF